MYQFMAIDARRRLRSGLRNRGLRRTKGSEKEERSHLFRLNIEKGWMVPWDDEIGGA